MLYVAVDVYCYFKFQILVIRVLSEVYVHTDNTPFVYKRWTGCFNHFLHPLIFK